jgi:hypothetical protein
MFRDNGSEVGGLGGKQANPGFAYSETVFTVDVMGMFRYFNCFSDYEGTVAADFGCGFCFVKVNAVSGCCGMFSYR